MFKEILLINALLFAEYNPNVPLMTLNFETNFNNTIEHVLISQQYIDLAEFPPPEYSEIPTIINEKEYLGRTFNEVPITYQNNLLKVNQTIYYAFWTTAIISGYMEVPTNSSNDISAIEIKDYTYSKLEVGQPNEDSLINVIFSDTITNGKLNYTFTIGTYYNDSPGSQDVIQNLQGIIDIETTYKEPTITNEIIDIPSLIFTIIGLPFTFILNAFNLTIFEGTAYELNFSDIIMLILGGLTLIFIIKKIMEIKG